jgi:uncharacterized repeat protein (TIGR03847 family)
VLNPSFDFPNPDHVTVGTVGEPGARVFYLQVGAAGSVASFKLEKQQAAALAEYLGSVLADLPEPEVAPLPAPDLIEPVTSEWTVGGIGIAYDEDADRVLLVVHEVEVVPDDDDDLSELGDDPDLDAPQLDDDGAAARIRITRPQVAALIERCTELVAAGRPLCPFCGRPDGPDGHFCPREN